MSQKVQELLHLILNLKKIMPVPSDTKKVDPFTWLRIHVLGIIEEKRALEMNEIARMLCITPPSATSLINHLVRSGFLARIADSKDRRKVLLKITPKGKKALRQGREQIEKHMEEIFSVLSAQEIDQFISILRKLIKKHS